MAFEFFVFEGEFILLPISNRRRKGRKKTYNNPLLLRILIPHTPHRNSQCLKLLRLPLHPSVPSPSPPPPQCAELTSLLLTNSCTKFRILLSVPVSKLGSWNGIAGPLNSPDFVRRLLTYRDADSRSMIGGAPVIGMGLLNAE